MPAKKTAKEKVIPFHFIPDREGKLRKIDNKDYLLMNDAFYTFFERSMGEFSDFFLAIRDRKKILGCKCTRCGIVRVPPFVTHCMDCNFAPTETVEVEQVGTILSTPPITYFANALFLDKAPFGRGRVTLKGADTAMSVMLYTTTGILRPGVIKKDTQVKIVFRDKRIGEITDIFAVPAAELKASQVAKKGLLESEIDWAAAKEPSYGKASPADKEAFAKSLKELTALAKEFSGSKRARAAIDRWKRNIRIKCRGGAFGMVINDGDIKIGPRVPAKLDFVMACEQPQVLLDGLLYKGAITDAIVTNKLWISKNIEFNTVFKLDRLARFLAREKKEKSGK
jgi:uncharacterized OB-fold protein